ncbi:MAG: glycosyltransferase family 9 protein [Ignavibacteriae bacterium]|nr:glycosyltransferase family 9 protein [Ignavibacteriota bacterium]MCB9209491.1 glycosyltransferase family 9 protein [Ignavibacteriales bacterium]MCB9258134.1 glycosyltransferase family 9 protein [Ignavibacteriales bacterium]
MNLENANKILIIRLSSLGDILLTTPLVRTVKNLNHKIKIDYLVRKEFIDTLKYNPNIEQVIELERNYKSEVIREIIKAGKYDIIIDVQNNFRSRVLTKGQTAQIFRYKKPYLDRWLLVKFKINRFKEIIPIPQRYANSIPDFKLDRNGLELFLKDNSQSKIESNDKTIGFCPGSKHQTKMWPENYFIELGNKLIEENYNILLFGGKDDKEICARISTKISGSINLSNDNELLELASNMKKCSVIICNDSGLMHTALSVNLPVIAIFGSTVKEFGFAPYKGKNLVLENNSLSCRPCSHIGLDKCPKNHLKCMTEIKPNYVYNQTINFLNSL